MDINSPFEDGVSLQGSEGGGEGIEAEHHPLVLADHYDPSVGCVERHLPFALVEKSLDLVFRDGAFLVKDEDLVGQDPGVEVEPAAAAHVPPDGDVSRPGLPLDPPVGQV
jgi:hypothetical protein